MPRQGEDFHRLVEHLERAVARQPGVTIESPKYLPDKITGMPREHDIILTYELPQRQLVVAIECRDRSRKVGVGQVEEFQTKCRNTGVSKGVIVASAGFAGTALVMARHYDIDCLTFAQVEEVEWCAQNEVVIRRREPRHVHVDVGIPLSLRGKRWRLFLRIADGADEEVDIQIVDKEGEQIVLRGQPDNLVRRIWPHIPDPGDELSGTVHVEIGNLEAFYFLDGDGTEHPVKRLCLEISYEAVESMSSLTFYRYGAETEKPIYEMIVTDIESFGDIKGNIMIIRDDQLGLRLQIVPTRSSTDAGTAVTAKPEASLSKRKPNRRRSMQN